MGNQQNQSERQTQEASRAQDDEPKKGVFSEFSMTSVVASALAAVTSFALQSKIGLAGSIIGVGVAAAATAVATQVYKGMLAASAEKIKAIPDQDRLSPGMTQRMQATDAGNRSAADQSATYYDTVTGQDVTADQIDPEHTVIRHLPHELEQDLTPLGGSGEYAETGTPIPSNDMSQAAAQRRAKRLRRGAAIVTVIVAIAAVLAYALVITVATSGQGIGSTEPIISPTTTDPTESGPYEPLSKATGSSSEEGKSEATASEGEKTAENKSESEGTSSNSSKGEGTSESEGASASNGSSSHSNGKGESGSGSGSSNGTGSGSSGSSSNSGSASGNTGSSSGSKGESGSGSGSANSSGSTSGSGSSTGSSSAGGTTSSASKG